MTDELIRDVLIREIDVSGGFTPDADFRDPSNWPAGGNTVGGNAWSGDLLTRVQFAGVDVVFLLVDALGAPVLPTTGQVTYRLAERFIDSTTLAAADQFVTKVGCQVTEDLGRPVAHLWDWTALVGRRRELTCQVDELSGFAGADKLQIWMRER